MESNEFFYKDKDGKKQDAAIHEDILDNLAADRFCRLQSFHSVLFRFGWGLEKTMQAYKITPEELESEENREVIEMRTLDGLESYTGDGKS